MFSPLVGVGTRRGSRTKCAGGRTRARAAREPRDAGSAACPLLLEYGRAHSSSPRLRRRTPRRRSRESHTLAGTERRHRRPRAAPGPRTSTGPRRSALLRHLNMNIFCTRIVCAHNFRDIHNAYEYSYVYCVDGFYNILV